MNQHTNQHTNQGPYYGMNPGTNMGMNPDANRSPGANAGMYSHANQNCYQQPQYQNQSKKPNPPKKVKPPKKPNHFGITIGKVAICAVIFGLIAGGIFAGIAHIGTKNTSATRVEKDEDSNTETTDAQVTSMVVATVESSEVIGHTQTGEMSAVMDVSAIVEAAMPSIVSIATTYTGMYSGEGCGSGIIVAQNSDYIYIVTNNHVVEGADSLSVQFCDESVVSGSIKGTYATSDLAVVQVMVSSIEDDTLELIKVATIGDSTNLKVGEGAIAIGNALGYGQSVTTGVISALGRSVTAEGSSPYETVTNYNLIQTDAAINPGNSGGALLNMRGELIGINSMKYSDTAVEGIGYAIPMEDAKPVIEQLLAGEDGSVMQGGYLGIIGKNAQDSQTSDVEGVYVVEVTADSPAEDAGIKSGDIIIGLDKKEITSMDSLKSALNSCVSGQTVTLTILRKNGTTGKYTEMEIAVILGTS